MDIQKLTVDFGRAMGNGATMGAVFAQAVDHVIAERDTTVVVRLIRKAQEKKDAQAERAVRTTFGAIFEGAKITRAKDKTIVGIKIKDATLSNSAKAALDGLVRDKVSMRGTKWGEAFKKDGDTPKEFDVKAFVERTLKNHKDIDPAVFAAAFQAAKK